MLSKKMEDAMNKQVNAEFYSSFLYLSMSADFESKNFLGFANWLKIQAEEEYSHAMKFYSHIIERGGKVKLAAIDAPESEWDKASKAFGQAYEHEQKVTAMINKLMDIAESEKDYASRSFLTWFVDEQVEEEANASQIVETLKLIGENTNGLFALDHRLGKRKKD